MEDDQLTASIRLALDRATAGHEVSAGAWPRIEHRARRRGRRRITAAVACAAGVIAAAAVTPQLLPSRPGPAPRDRAAGQLTLVGRSPIGGYPQGITTGYGAVWIIGLNTVDRVDPVTGKVVATIRTPGSWAASSIAAGAGAVWVTVGTHHRGVDRINPRSDRVVAYIPVRSTAGIAVDRGLAWVIDQTRRGVVRISPRTNRVDGAPIPVGDGAEEIAAGGGALWVTNTAGRGSVSRIDPATGAVTRMPANIPDVDAVGAGSLWVQARSGRIQRVDPATGRVTATIRGLRTAWALFFWAGSAWAWEGPSGKLVRIDPASNRVTGPATSVGKSPALMAAGASGVWVIDVTRRELLHFALAAGR